MQFRKRYAVAALVALAAAAAATVGVAASSGGAAAKDKVTVQLKWVTQAQFAGYYAAAARGYYDKLNLDVTIRPGGPDIIPEQVVLGRQAKFGLNWQGNLLVTRDTGGALVNIGQVFTRSGTTEIAWRDSGIKSFCQLRGKNVGVWLGGNEHEQFAALRKCGINPSDKNQVTIVAQGFDMNAFLKRELDAASAMTYNELAQVLEVKNSDTGKLYQLSDLRVFKYSALGTGMQQDGLYVREDWISSAKNQDIARRFLQATFQGWIYCRDHLKACVNIVLKNGTALGRGHQTWQMNEINRLIWPAPLGIGVMNPAEAARTVKVATQGKLIKKAPGKWYRTDLSRAAVANLRKQGLDVAGKSWKPAVVKITEGGK